MCPMNGQGKSSMMAALIDQADAKRRCIEATTVGRESGVRDARYGLRDVRVGEATHPGPQGRPRDTSHEVLDNLGRELRLMESDDEPLVRSMDGRNVVPRITSIVATEASERRRCDVHSLVHDEGVPSNSAGGVDPYLGRSGCGCFVRVLLG